MLRYFQIKLFPNITTLFYWSQLHVPLLYFICHSYMFHCMSGIEGGGEDTVAWASCSIEDFTSLGGGQDTQATVS